MQHRFFRYKRGQKFPIATALDMAWHRAIVYQNFQFSIARLSCINWNIQRNICNLWIFLHSSVQCTEQFSMQYSKYKKHEQMPINTNSQ